MRKKLHGRLELPQLSKASGERPQEVTLCDEVCSTEETCKRLLRTLAVRGLGPERLECSRCRFFSLN
jgi:hypothetical protein